MRVWGFWWTTKYIDITGVMRITLVVSETDRVMKFWMMEGQKAMWVSCQKYAERTDIYQADRRGRDLQAVEAA